MKLQSIVRLRRRSFIHVGVASLSALLSLGQPAYAQVGKPLKIGVVAGALADSAQVAAQEAKKQGLAVEIIEFSDFTTPNAALDAGDLDGNFFQHQAFLDEAIRQRGYKLKSIGLGPLSAYGIYAHKANRIQDIPQGARVGIYNDVVNQARALKLLADNDLITLRPGSGPSYSLNDISANPKKLRFIEVDGMQLTRSYDDVDVAVLYPFRLVLAGRAELAERALAFSANDDVYYAARLVARENNTNDPRLHRFLRIYQDSPIVRKAIHQTSGNSERLYSLPWLKASRS